MALSIADQIALVVLLWWLLMTDLRLENVALTNEDIRNSESYKEYYAMASGTIPPKTKGSKKKANTETIPKLKPPTAPKEKKSGKGKQKTAELETISEADLTEAEQLKIITKRSRQETHSSHASGSGADEGTGVTPGVPDAPDYDSEDDISWKSSDDDQADEQAEDDEDAGKNDVNETTQDDEDDDDHDDDEKVQDDDEHDVDETVQEDDDEEQTESDDDGDDFVHPKLTTHDDEIIHEEDTDEDDSSISSSDEEDSDNEVEGTNVEGAKSDEEATYEEDQGTEAVEDTNTDLDGRDEVMTDVILPQVQATQEIEDTQFKKILLKLNLSDHRLFKMVVEVPDSSCLTRSIATCSYPTDKHKDIMKAQNFKKDATLKLFKNGMSMSVQKSQVHKMAKFQDGKEIITSILQVGNGIGLILTICIKGYSALGLESVEVRLAHYKKNEAMFEESINVLKLEVRLRDNSLNDLLESQVIDKFKTGLGYNAATAVESFVNLSNKSGSDKGYQSVPPPLSRTFIPGKPYLTFIDEIVESENMNVTTVVIPSNDKTVENKGVSNTVESNAVKMNNSSAPIIEDWNSDDESEIDYTVRPSTEKIKFIKTVRETDAPKQNKHHPRGNQRNWNNLMSQRLDIMFAVCACARFQVTPKTSHLNAVKRIFRYLKGQPKLGLWYPRDSPFDLEAFSDSDYAGASLDRKSTTGGCQFLGKRLISWQYKKQTIVANSTTKAEYVTAANCCGQVLWIQNQMLDYGFNFMNTKIYIDNESTICIVKNPVFHSKTKHIEIRHHFIRDSYEKKLIQVIKIHTDQNVADLLTKAFDASRVKTAKAVHKELGDRMEMAATTASSLEAEQDSEMEITATIDGRVKTITEASIRRHLKLEDLDGIPTLPNAEIFEQLALMGYAFDSDNPKKTAWEQFSSNIATAIICLATNRTFNFSKMIFEGMLKNLDSSDEGSLILNELTVLYTTLSKKVEDLKNDLKQTKLTYGVAYTKLILRVKKLEHKGRIIAEIGQNPFISLVQDEGTSWIQEDAETQGRTSVDTEVLLDQEEPTELVEDPGSVEKGEKEISTAEVPISTVSAIPIVSTVIPERQVYIRRSVEKRKDKGKATIMKDDESVQKKTKKQLEQERLGHEKSLLVREEQI
ncbi:hypothetical protein Tco_0359954 [Tanacetum coccineum]